MLLPRLQRLREMLVLCFLAVLPFHALLVTVGTKLFLGPGHAPLPALALWKEVFLGFLCLIVALEILLSRSGRRFDVVDVLILALAFLGIAVSLRTRTPPTLALLGFKYDFVALFSFFMLRRVAWSDWWSQRVFVLLLGLGGLLAAYGILSFFLTDGFFRALGYSDAYSLYFPEKPLTSFQLIAPSALRRIQSTFSGPNQFAAWLLLPFSCALSWRAARVVTARKYLLLILLLLALLLTFSRAAWIAAVAIFFVHFLPILRERLRKTSPKILSIFVGCIVLCCTLLLLAFPGVIVRLGSSRGHIERPIEAVRRMISVPLGSGLGTVGPASHRASNVCIFLRPQDDPAWAKVHPELCVFLGERQVQPEGRACRCPFLPENWYLQIGVELGVLGFVLFCALTFFLLRTLRRASSIPGGHSPLVQPLFLSFMGVSIVALFLHAWEDSSVAYSVWVMMAGSLNRR